MEVGRWRGDGQIFKKDFLSFFKFDQILGINRREHLLSLPFLV